MIESVELPERFGAGRDILVLESKQDYSFTTREGFPKGAVIE